MIAPGSRLGCYEITALLGVGGMGEVYHARDTRLKRDVAIKTLPEAFAADADRLARFQREAEVLASLNHPHIAAIYGVEESGGVKALVMELVDGATLEQRIAKGPLPVAEALRIATQVAEGLEAAHEKGIIHRDLKPANVKVSNDGVVKILDFGLAKAVAQVVPSDAPIVTFGATREGFILGTPAYMSPEQARGSHVDKRTDIWAFGCLLYEMLTGRQPFARATITETLAAVFESEPNWSSLPPGAPAGVMRVLRRTLSKDPAQRLRDVADARLDLEGTLEGASEAAATTLDLAKRWPIRAGVLAVLVAGVFGAWRTFQPPNTGADAPPVVRTTVMLPSSHEMDTQDRAAPLAISPDGARVAYVAHRAGITELYVRDLGAFVPTRLPATDGAAYPFFSPDGGSIGFFADRKLKRVSISGGSPVTICDVTTVGLGASWGADGSIVFDPGDHGLMRVAATGGTPQRITTGDPDVDALRVVWPHFLPNGRALVATIQGAGDGQTIAALPLDSPKWKRLFAGMQAQYVSSGHLLFHAPTVREGEVQAIAFDTETLTPKGLPVSLLEGVFRARNGGAIYFAAAPPGVAAYASGSYSRTLVRVDRNGRREPLLDERRGFRFPDISPNGRQVAVTIDPRPSQVWVYDLLRRSGIPLEAEGHSLRPLWTPDGARVTYAARGEVYWRAADGSTPAERVLERDRPQYPSDWTADGNALLFNDDAGAKGGDIWLISGTEQRPLIVTPASELNARLSPDQRWVAYMSDESGRMEVYVRPFPEVSRQKWILSTGGGHTPVWAHSGRELFYMQGSQLMVVPVDGRAGSFAAGRATVLFSGPFDTTQDNNYDVFPDDNSFVMVEADPDARPVNINVIQNWSPELQRLVPIH